ncbi:MAG: C39 family peptidase [Anaerolineales bacterium]|nr:C39 family peptidase [Anaerolineales bacterium]NUQ84016.1 C39 family peptidase [Anaerolineales bacterium]
MKRKDFNRKWIFPIVLILGIVVFYLPPVYSRLMPRVEALQSSVKYWINPPEEAVFQPAGQAPTETPSGTSSTRTPPPTLTQTLTPTTGPTLTPTITTTPLPASVNLTGFRYEDQKNRWNYCGPANLSMALNYVGWNGNRDTVAKSIKPGIQDPKLDFIQQGRSDVNVMPYEMVDFVNDETEFRALSRLGGDIEIAKKLVAAGFPLIAEKGYYEKDYTGKIAWLGHYQFVTGYDDARGELIVQDTWNDGPNFRIRYDEFMAEEAWLSFDNLFIVVYKPEREADLMQVLGPYADPMWAAAYALGMAEEKIAATSGIDQYFAWYAKGTSHVALQQYSDAALAYDQAFVLYNSLGKDDIQRPYRMMWYQTGPYWAYFYTGRYLDVINLANVTLTETISKPTIEESIYWRGRAKYMIGDTPGAIADFREALRLHPNWAPAIQALQDLGIQP